MIRYNMDSLPEEKEQEEHHHLQVHQCFQESVTDWWCHLEPGDLLEPRWKGLELAAPVMVTWMGKLRESDSTTIEWIRVFIKTETTVMFLGYYMEDHQETDLVKLLYKDQVLYTYKFNLEHWFSVVDITPNIS